jgi:hypothetical protein
MIALKNYRKLSPQETLEIVPTLDTRNADENFSLLESDLPKDFFFRMVSEKRMSASIIRHNGENAYLIIWQKEFNGKHLHVCASLFIGAKSNHSVWGDGVERIALQNGCIAVTFATQRKGHIAAASAWGAVVTGVTMKKALG